jgi:hypothetical protein
MRLTYKERLQQSLEDKTSQDIQFKASEASLQLQQDILNTGRELSVSKRNLEAAKSAYPFNSQAIINCQQDVEGYEEAMRRLEDLGRELFGIGIEKAEAQESTYDKINKSLGIPVGKKSKAKTEAGKARAARKGLVVPEQE